jgi:hypothetical protein
MWPPEVGSASTPSMAGRRKYGGLEVNEALRLRQLEDENGRLKSKRPVITVCTAS